MQRRRFRAPTYWGCNSSITASYNVIAALTPALKMEDSYPSSRLMTPRKTDWNNSSRKVKDNAADWHNLILKWETCNDAGFTIANKIVNIKLHSKSGEMEQEQSDGEDDFTAKPGKATVVYNKELDQHCTELLNLHDKMVKLVLKMEKLCTTMKGVNDLDTFHYGETGRQMPLFHTWPTRCFYEISVELLEMYRKELQLKSLIVQEIAHTRSCDLMMVQLSSWLYQPYIEEKARLLVESMLLETGHRVL
ncbi:cyclin-dependent kinase 2-interacting protein [Amblyraja radiata]|uniref:cyclin-dependent kinase 2-interacting protein n=1 Tax=Amblyraja radiata TaxID=386614 RepID=UPI001403D1B1|nr:cyclin-dependent kinase 2-interacting protein [Amblyraja radiata]